LLAFPLPALRDAIDRDERTRWAWIGMLSAQTRQQRARIERQSLKTIRERLEHLILSEGSAPAGYLIPGTKIQLAAELGVTPEALYRCLSALRAEGKLSVEGRRLAWRVTDHFTG
jgi:CRP-like cAMP-binding protein